MSALIQRNCKNIFKTARFFCSKSQIPRNVIEDLVSAQNQTKPGVIYDKKPFRINLQSGKFKIFKIIA